MPGSKWIRVLLNGRLLEVLDFGYIKKYLAELMYRLALLSTQHTRMLHVLFSGERTQRFFNDSFDVLVAWGL